MGKARDFRREHASMDILCWGSNLQFHDSIGKMMGDSLFQVEHKKLVIFMRDNLFSVRILNPQIFNTGVVVLRANYSYTNRWRVLKHIRAAGVNNWVFDKISTFSHKEIS